MTSMNEEEKIFQADERGRVRVSTKRREALLDDIERSVISGAKFARLAGIKYPTFTAPTDLERFEGTRRICRETGVRPCTALDRPGNKPRRFDFGDWAHSSFGPRIDSEESWR